MLRYIWRQAGRARRVVATTPRQGVVWHRRCLTTTTTTTTDDKSPDAWIPPNRPLLGDQQSHPPTQLPPAPPTSAIQDDDVDEEEELRRLQEEIDQLDAEEKEIKQNILSTKNDETLLSSSLADNMQTTHQTRTIEENEEDPISATLDEEEELRILKEEIDKLEEEDQKMTEEKSVISPPDEETSVDWLRTRRKRMGETSSNESSIENGWVPTLPGVTRHEDLFNVEVKHHTLLKKDEIATIMDALGGQDIKVIYDDPNDRRMGGAMGLILVTATRSTQIRILADTLVRQMRRRKLQEVDVSGAQQGPEGQEDSNWMVVDCRNFIVHIFDEQTRTALNLEDLWSGKDPLHKLNFYDEDAVEDYVAAHPVPDNYGAPVFDWDERFRELQKNRWTAPHKPVVRKPKTKRRKR